MILFSPLVAQSAHWHSILVLNKELWKLWSSVKTLKKSLWVALCSCYSELDCLCWESLKLWSSSHSLFVCSKINTWREKWTDYNTNTLRLTQVALVWANFAFSKALLLTLNVYFRQCCRFVLLFVTFCLSVNSSVMHKEIEIYYY